MTKAGAAEDWITQAGLVGLCTKNRSPGDKGDELAAAVAAAAVAAAKARARAGQED